MNTKAKYRVLFGREGIDNYFLKYADGTIEPWPTKEKIKQWELDLFGEERWKVLKILEWKKSKLARF